MSLTFSPSFRHMEGELKVESSMDSSSFCYNQLQEQQQQQQQHSSLTRYRSAPSTFFEIFINGNDDDLDLGSDDFNDFLRASSPEMDAGLARMVSTADSSKDLNLEGNDRRPVKEEVGLQQHNGFLMDQKTMYDDVGNSVQVKMGHENRSNLIRQSSSPAGFLSNITAENGFAARENVAKLGARGLSSSKVNICLSYSSGQISGYNSGITEMVNENNGISILNNQQRANGNSSSKYYMPDFPNKLERGTSLSGLKRIREEDTDLPSSLSMSKHPGTVMEIRNTSLTQHLSLPKNFRKTAAVEILHFQDSAPCKIRAKRGCATHPRSIAERVRRGRISERMKKLQELFPNMDKQANTADMLDMALESIKDLQNQVKILSENRARCICASNQK